MNLRKIFISVFFEAILVCSSGLSQQAEEQPLATRIEHFYLESGEAQSLFTYFKDTLQLPEVWPFFERGTFASGGLSLGNVVMEFVLFPHKKREPMKTEFQGIAFEPARTADATLAELIQRNIPNTDVRTYKHQIPGGQAQIEWSSVGLKDFPPTEADIFFCDYKDRQAVAAGRKAAMDDLAARKGGPLGIVGAAEITVGVQDLEEARRKWSALLAPSPQISDDAFVFNAGPRIRLVHAQSPGIQGIVLKVLSVDRAARFLEERGLLAKDCTGRIAISPAAIGGLSIHLVSVNETPNQRTRKTICYGKFHSSCPASNLFSPTDDLGLTTISDWKYNNFRSEAVT